MTRSSRRAVLKTGGLAGLATLLPRRAAAAGKLGARSAPVLAPVQFWPLRSSFAAQLGTTFWVNRRSLRPVRLQLVSVGDLPSAKIAGTVGFEESFAIEFHGPGGVPLRQGTYRLQHASLGAIDVFIVPVGPQGKLRTYEAIYNHQTA